MGIPFEQRNFQKELEKKIAGFQKDGIVPTLCFFTAAVHRVAAIA